MATEYFTLHEDAFYEGFKPYRHPDASHNIWGGHGLETFGADLEIVRSLDRKYLWTVVEGDNGRDAWISPGFHHVNRICYLVTERPHHWIAADFRVPTRPTSLTPIGLARQLRKIEQLLAAALPIN